MVDNGDSPLLACPTCGKQFKYPSDLAAHATRHRAYADRAHECALCHKRFHDAAALRAHSATHLSERPRVKCEHCGQLFLSTKSLKRHQQARCPASAPIAPVVAPSMTPRVKCPVRDCGKAFDSTTSLNAHLRKVHRKRLQPQLRAALQTLRAAVAAVERDHGLSALGLGLCPTTLAGVASGATDLSTLADDDLWKALFVKPLQRVTDGGSRNQLPAVVLPAPNTADAAAAAVFEPEDASSPPKRARTEPEMGVEMETQTMDSPLDWATTAVAETQTPFQLLHVLPPSPHRTQDMHTQTDAKEILLVAEAAAIAALALRE